MGKEDKDFSISPRKSMAEGKEMPDSKFGVESMEGRSMAHPDKGMSHMAMKDGERAASKPMKHTRGEMPAQANADHGPQRMYR